MRDLWIVTMGQVTYVPQVTQVISILIIKTIAKTVIMMRIFIQNLSILKTARISQ